MPSQALVGKAVQIPIGRHPTSQRGQQTLARAHCQQADEGPAFEPRRRIRVGGEQEKDQQVNDGKRQIDHKGQHRTDRLQNERKGKHHLQHRRRLGEATHGSFIAVIIRIVGGGATVQKEMEGEESDPKFQIGLSVRQKISPQENWCQQDLKMQA